MRTIQLRIRCGKLICRESPGVFCQYFRQRLDSSRPNCVLFNARLGDFDNRDVWRCDECLSIDTETVSQTARNGPGREATFQCGTCGRVVEPAFGSDEQCLACDREDLKKEEEQLLQYLREESDEEIPTLDVSVEAAARLGDFTDRDLADITQIVQDNCKSDLIYELWETIEARLRRSSRGSMRSEMYKGSRAVSKDKHPGLYPPPPDRLWFLIDVSNSTGDGVKNYGRFFLSKKEARAHMLEQNSDPNKADLIGPFHYRLEDRW